jgi:hypothetical protein
MPMEFGYTVGKDNELLLYPKCPVHNWHYKGMSTPPMTHGCKTCWEAYYFGVHAQTPSDDQGCALDLLETAINHMVEHEKKGTWDFKPQFDIQIEKDGLPD